MKFKLPLLFLFLGLCIAGCNRGKQDIDMAYNCMQRGSVDSASTFINAAITNKSTFKDASTWYLKGFINKELYKKYVRKEVLSSKNNISLSDTSRTHVSKSKQACVFPNIQLLKELIKKYEQHNAQVAYRDTALCDLFISFTLDSSEENIESVFPTIKYLAGTYYNDAAESMDLVNYLQAMAGYNIYKYCMKHIAPLEEFSKYDVQFHLALGNVYSEKFDDDTNNIINQANDWDSSFAAYNYILTNIDSLNNSANYGVARLCYNFNVCCLNKMKDVFDTACSRITTITTLMVHPHLSSTYETKPFNKAERQILDSLIDGYFVYLKKKAI